MKPAPAIPAETHGAEEATASSALERAVGEFVESAQPAAPAGGQEEWFHPPEEPASAEAEAPQAEEAPPPGWFEEPASAETAAPEVEPAATQPQAPPAAPSVEPARAPEPRPAIDIVPLPTNVRSAARRGPRLYEVREVAAILAAFAALMLALDSEGLLTWARRMEAGAVQEYWLAALTPLYRACDAVKLTAPRRAASNASQSIARKLGGGEDPLFAEAWKRIGELSVDTFDEQLEWPDTEEPAGDELAGRLKTTQLGDGHATVLLMGDSLMAGSLGAAIANSLAADPRLRVVRAHQIGTGLSRPDLFDWQEVTAQLIERERPRIAIVSLGGNDAQAIRHQGQLLTFGSQEWTDVYRRRVRGLMQALAGPETQVLWLGLPPMRSEGFSRRAAQMNHVFEAAARRTTRVAYLELGMLLTGRDEGYSTFIRDEEGRLLRVRMEDGVHYTAAGARRVAPWVVDWVYEVIGRRPNDG